MNLVLGIIRLSGLVDILVRKYTRRKLNRLVHTQTLFQLQVGDDGHNTAKPLSGCI